MNHKQTIALFGAMLMLLFFASVLRLMDKADASERLASFPRSGPGFMSRSLLLTDFEKDIIGEANAYKAIYSWKGTLYALTIIDGSRNRQAVHDPRYCFRGAGWTIVSYNETRIKGGRAEYLRLKKAEGITSEALFFYSDGNSAFYSPLMYWYKATLKRWIFFREINEPVLVLIQPFEENGTLEPVIKGLLPLLPLP